MRLRRQREKQQQQQQWQQYQQQEQQQQLHQQQLYQPHHRANAYDYEDDVYVAHRNRAHPIEWWVGYTKERGISHKSVTNQTPKGLDKYSKSKRVQYTSGMSNKESEIVSATRGIHFQTTEDRTIRRLLKEHENRHIAANMSYIQKIRTTANSHKSDELSEDLKRAVRGKTAGQISLAILAESEKNLKESKKLDQLLIESERIQRGNCTARIVHRVQHVDLQDQNRSIDQLGHSVGSSLYDVKTQLNSLNQRTLDIYQDSRFRRNYLPKISLYR